MVDEIGVGDRVAYVDEWGPGPYRGTVTFRCNNVYHVEWDGTEGPLMVQRGERLHKIPLKTYPHQDARVVNALERLCSSLDDLYEAGYFMGQRDSGVYFFHAEEDINILRDEDTGWEYKADPK